MPMNIHIDVDISACFKSKPRLKLILGPIRERIMPPRDAETVFRIEDSQAFTLQVEPDDKAGNPTTLPDGTSLSWSTSDPDVLTATPGPDGFTCDFVTTGRLGVAQVSVTAGDLSGMLSIEVVPGTAATLKLTPVNVRDRT